MVEGLEPAREQVNFVWLAIIGVVVAGALGWGAVRLKRLVSRRILPADAAMADHVDADAEDAIEVAMIVADSSSRLPAHVRRTLREGTHADLVELCRPGATSLLETPEIDQEAHQEDADDIESLLAIEDFCAGMLDDELLGEGEADSGDQFGDPLLRFKLATGYLLKPSEVVDTPVKVDPGSVMELHLGLLQTVKLEKLQKSTHSVGHGMDVLVEGPLLKLATVANIQCWDATYVRVWADGRWVETDDFVQTDEHETPGLNMVPTNVTTVFDVMYGADPQQTPAATQSEQHDAVLTVLTGKRGTNRQVYCAADAAQAHRWVSACETLAKTSVLPQPALIQFLEERSLGAFALKLAELAKIRTVDQLAITPVSDATLLLVGMNRFKQRIYRRAVRDAYKQQSTAAAKAAHTEAVPTIYEKKEEEERRHEIQKQKIKVTEKSRAKKRKELEANEAQTLDTLGSRLMFDVEAMGVAELRRLMGDSDEKIKADNEARERERQQLKEKASQQAKLADTGSLLEGWACESCMHFNQDLDVKECGGCFAPSHLVGGPNIVSKTDAHGEERPTTPGGTIITKPQGSVLQVVKHTDEEIAAAKKAHHAREQAEAERKELGDGRGLTPEKISRQLKLDAATMITQVEARKGRIDKEKIKQRQQALEQAAAARKLRATAPERAPSSPRRIQPSRLKSARFARWMKSIWNTAPWMLRLRRQVPLAAPHLPGTAAFGSVRHSRYLEQTRWPQKTNKPRERVATKSSRVTSGKAGPSAAWYSDSDDDDDEDGHQNSRGDSRSQVQGSFYDSQEEEHNDPEDWWYRHMMKYGTDKIMRRKQ